MALAEVRKPPGIAGQGPVALPGQDAAGGQGQALVGGEQGRLEILDRADARAGRTGALRAVEGKKLGRGLGHADLAGRAGRGRGKKPVRGLALVVGHHQPAFALVEAEFHGVGQARADAVLDHQPVDHQVDGVALVFFELRQGFERHDDAADADPGEALAFQLFQTIGVGPFLVLDQGGQEQDLGPLGIGQDVAYDLVRRAGRYGLPALGAVGLAQAGEKDPQKVVDFRHRAHRGPGVSGGGLLFERDGRREALDLVHLRLVHLGQELAGVGGQGFHVAPLALGVDDVKGQGGLAGARRAADHHELVAGNVEGQVLQVVLARAFDMNMGSLGHPCLQEPFAASTQHKPERSKGKSV